MAVGYVNLQGTDSKSGTHDEGDGINDTTLALVVAGVGEELAEPIWHKSSSVAKSQGSGKDEAVPSREAHGRGDAHTRDSHSSEKEGRHSTENSAWNRNEGGRKLGKDASDDEEEAAGVTGLPVGATSQSNDTVVLRKGRHGGDCAETSEETVETVGKNSTLDARVKELALNLNARNITSGSDISDSLAGKDDVYRKHR